MADNNGLFFQDQEHSLVEERDYIDRFNTYKEETFALWGWPATNEARNKVKKKLTQKLNRRNCKDKKVCKKCKPIKDELNQLNKTWRNGHTLLKQRFAATKPGLIHGIYHEDDNKFFCCLVSAQKYTYHCIPSLANFVKSKLLLAKQ